MLSGGVAANSRLNEFLAQKTAECGLKLYVPSRILTTDNAAMIAAAGTVKLQAGERAGWDLNADVMLRLQNLEVEDDELRKRVRYRL